MTELRNILGPMRVLEAIHRCGGMGRAAAQLNITPGAVSHQIRRLETELGARVLAKSGRQMEFTEIGLALATGAAEPFERLEALVARASGLAGPVPIRVKVIPSLAIQWLMPRLAGFYAEHQDIDVEIATVARADDTELVNADFVVRRGRGDWRDLHAELLFQDELVLACAPALAERIASPADLLGEKLLQSMIAPASWDVWLRSVGLALADHTRVIPMANAALCLQAAVQGLGVAVTQRSYLASEFASGLLVRPLPQSATSADGYWLVCEMAKAHRRPYAQFSRWLVASARRTP
ncbi:LysR substrate-binding domain-containing protein [Xylophilus sp. GOD-11R]|uniref:LysR substrate-binding domain-containing protein n=1 Tax=Xylophilus sp. GOD-11R TaxID=3089814 RepID=UPI00298C8D0C|nr:LysR substrate-binding domain-containing protein [Xylophilus sp. GOD-11R]WPB55503.1 LysR substrate-binding domain-containing protein [Xylophilus sp. GOD-11R]